MLISFIYIFHFRYAVTYMFLSDPINDLNEK